MYCADYLLKKHHAFDCKMHIAIQAKDISTIKKLLQNGDKFCENFGCDCFYISKRTKDWNFVKSLLEIDPVFRKEHGHYFILEFLNQPEAIQYLLVEPFAKKEKKMFISSLHYCLMNVSVPVETLKILLEKGFCLFEYKDLVHNLTTICNNEPKTLDSFLKFEMCLELVVNNINIQCILDLLLSKNNFDQYCLLMFKELIKTNKVDVNNETFPLIQATRLKDGGMIVECVHELVQAGARTDVEDADGYSPLAHATNIVDPYVCYEVTRALLEAGATPDDRALRLLCRKHDELIVETIKLFPENYYYTPILYKAIHEQDSDINARDHEENTPLILASQIPDIGEALSAVRDLLNLEADPQLCNENGDTALHLAVARDLNMVLDLLNSHADPSVKNNQGKTPLIIASNIKHPENRLNTITTLLERDADLDCRDANGNTLLHLAFINFNSETTFGLIQLCLERGADPSAVNKNGETPLLVALKLKTNMEGIIKLLLLAGCDVDISDKITGYTPLHLAIEYTKSEKNIEILQLLLKRGCNPTRQCFNGNTALHYACQITSAESIWFEMINTLIQYGSNPNIVQALLKTNMIDLSIQNAKGETALLIIINHLVHHQIYTSDTFDSFVQILETGLNPFLDQKQNITLILSQAFSINHLEYGPRVVRMLLDMWISSGRGNTFPLSYSCFVNAIDNVQNPEIALRNVRHLLEIGADPLEKADQKFLNLKRTPERKDFDVLDHVVICTKFGNRDEIVRCLLEAVERRNDYHSYYSLEWNSHAEKMLTEHNNLPCSRMARLFNRFIQLFRRGHNRLDTESFIDRLIKYGFNEEFIHVGNLSVLIAFLNAGTTLFQEYVDTPEELVSSLMKKLIVKAGVDPCRRILCTFKDDEIQHWNQRLQLPDALWVAAMSGHNQCVIDLLPYWPATPLALLIFMYPLPGIDLISERVICDRILTLIPVLLKCGGPLPPGSPIRSRFCLVLDEFCRRIYISRSNIRRDVIKKFTNAHNTVPRLQDLCRVTIRGTFSGGLDLPDRIATLPLPVSITNFLNFSDCANPARVSTLGT